MTKIQLTETQKSIEYLLEKQLDEMKGFKFNETLKVTFEKQTGENQTTIKPAYFNSNTQTIINDDDVSETLQTIKQEILNSIGSGWTIESVGEHYVNLVKYKPLKGSSYIQLHCTT